MEERKLNFNAPLLSVRRSFARTAPSNGGNAKKVENSQRSRLLTLASCKADSSLDLVTEPVAVPFNWEQIPGRRKNSSIPDSYQHHEASVAQFSPRMALNEKPEYQNVFRPQVEASSFRGAFDCSKEGVNDKAVIDFENDDDVYSDALDTLSGTNSFFGHCSVSDVSGFGNLAIVKHSGTFATDPQIRDFMMSRFLPAAKAMTLEQPHYASRNKPVSGEQPHYASRNKPVSGEQPHYASRNKPVSGEQPRLITKVIQRDRNPSVIRNESLNMVPYHQDIEDEQSEDGGYEYSDSSIITTKGCGLLPRLCIKNSLCLLNPVPGMKVRTQNAVHGMRTRTQNSESTSRDSHGAKKINKAAFARSQSPTIKRPARDAVKPKLEDDARSPRLLLGVENKIACGSNRLTFTSDRQTISRTSPFRRSGAISPYGNEASQSPFRGQGFLGENESFKNNKWTSNSKVYSKSQELVPHYAMRLGSRPVSPTAEKTLYVDTVIVAGIFSSNSGSSNVKKPSVGSGANDIKALIRSREIQDTAASEILLEDLKCSGRAGKLAYKGLQSSNSTGMSPDRGKSDFAEDLSHKSKALVCISTGAADNNVNIANDQILDEDHTDNAETSLVVCPLPPLLPRTPSESWLWRTLPSISSQNRVYRGTSFRSKRQDPNLSSGNTKWENIVKSSYLHHDHVRYSEELFPHASQQSKS
ncbi:uncharacterized protein [Euphorbia lathyris]|uniref:uncharacterized protein n=1 Tax=Euphorbia lathyris TaxID=212925 RepID=UPI00331327B5